MKFLNLTPICINTFSNSTHLPKPSYYWAQIRQILLGDGQDIINLKLPRIFYNLPTLLRMCRQKKQTTISQSCPIEHCL